MSSNLEDYISGWTDDFRPYHDMTEDEFEQYLNERIEHRMWDYDISERFRYLAFRSSFRQANIPKRYKALGLQHFDDEFRQANSAAWQLLLDFLDNFPEKYLGQGRGLFLTGPLGTGKTMMACALARELCWEGYSVYYTRLNELLKRCIENQKHDNQADQGVVEMIIENADLLILDEVDKLYKPESGYIDLFIDNVFARRYENCGSLIAVSNTITDLDMVLGDYVIDRFRESLDTVELIGKSHRDPN